MKTPAESIVKVMLFCQHIQEAKNDGLELGLLGLMVNCRNFFLPVIPLGLFPSKTWFQPGLRHLNFRSFTFSGSDTNYYISRKKHTILSSGLYESKPSINMCSFIPDSTACCDLKWISVSLIHVSFGKTSLAQKSFTLSSYLLSCSTECSQTASTFTGRKCIVHKCFIIR